MAQLARRSGKPLWLAVNKTEGFDHDIAVADFHQLGLGEPHPIAAAHDATLQEVALAWQLQNSAQSLPIPSLPLSSADAATIAEIDAAARLSFDDPKKESLGRVAQRTTLAPAVQVHLVNVLYRSLAFDDSKVVQIGIDATET